VIWGLLANKPGYIPATLHGFLMNPQEHLRDSLSVDTYALLKLMNIGCSAVWGIVGDV
jgi:hypothetical protein